MTALTTREKRRLKRLNKGLVGTDLKVIHHRALHGDGQIARAENLRRLIWPWQLIQRNPYAPRKAENGEHLDEYRTLDEAAAACGVLLGDDATQVNLVNMRAFTDEELVSLLRARGASGAIDLAKRFGVAVCVMRRQLYRMVDIGKLTVRVVAKSSYEGTILEYGAA